MEKVHNSDNFVYRLFNLDGFTDISHVFVGLECKLKPISPSLFVDMGRNIDATSLVGDLGSVVAEYILMLDNSGTSLIDAHSRGFPDVRRIYDNNFGDADLKGDIDASLISWQGSVYQSMKRYYELEKPTFRFRNFVTVFKMFNNNLELNEEFRCSLRRATNQGALALLAKHNIRNINFGLPDPLGFPSYLALLERAVQHFRWKVDYYLTRGD